MAEVRRRVEEAVARAVAEHRLWEAGAALVVAVSGGADSICLLGTLLALHARGGEDAPGALTVAHLDHGMRGAASADDARWVAEFATELGLRVVTERLDVPALARAERRSLEDAARRARYAFLRRVARDAGAARVCVGHTQDDQAETVTLHWLRGSGLAGLSGMAPLQGDIARPLLGVTRAETHAYCAERGWSPRADASNDDLRFMRNRVRTQLFPELERYNPHLRVTLARNAALLAADEAYLEAQTDVAWRRLATAGATSGREGGVRLAREGLCEQPLALRHRLLRRAAQYVAGAEAALEARHIALLDALLVEGNSGSALDLPGGVRVILGYAALSFALRDVVPEAADAVALPADAHLPVALPVPGAVELPALGWRVRAAVMELPAGLEGSLDPSPLDDAPPLAHAGLAAELERAEMRAYLDADAAEGPFTVRTWQPGDRFRPLGLRAEKKLQDFFSDAKVPRALRTRLPLVFGARHLLWVAGQRIDDRVRLTPATRRVLVLQLEPLEGL